MPRVNVPDGSLAYLLSDAPQQGSPGVSGAGQLLFRANREYFDYRHNGRVNMLYFDGHVSTLDFEQTATSASDIEWHGGTL